MHRTLVIGGAGFIGSHLVRHLETEVLVADSLHPQIHDGVVPGWLRERAFSGVSVEDHDSVRALMEWFRPHTIFHLAAETGTGQSLTEPARHCRTNVAGLANVLEAITETHAPTERIVLASSRAVYGEGAWAGPDGVVFYPSPRTAPDLTRGDWTPWLTQHPGAVALPHDASLHWPRPTSVYASTKLAQEHILATWALGHGVRAAIVRLQNVYGPGQSESNPYAGVLLHFVRAALDKRPIPVYEDGQVSRDFVHVSDAARSLVAAAAQDGDTRPIDIGSGTRASLLTVATKISQVAGGPEPKVTGMFRIGDVRAASADPSRAQQLLGFVAETSLDDGIEGLVDWMRRT